MKAEGRPVGSYLSLGVETETDDLPKHYLLCNECEQFLGIAESYIARITKGTEADLKAARVHLSLISGAPTLSLVNTNLVYRAAAANVLRCHLSKSYLCKNVNLNRHELTELRNAILTDSYPPSRFTLEAVKWVNSTAAGVNPRSILNIDFQRIANGAFFDVLMAGMSWMFFFGPAPKYLDFLASSPNKFEVHLLREVGWEVGVAEWSIHRYITNTTSIPPMADRRAWMQMNADDPCPCGLWENTFGSCCWGRWLSPGRRATPS